MKVVWSPLVFSLALAGLAAFAAGCGPSASICASYPCASGKPVQLCEDSDGNLSYRFNGTSCGCNRNDTTACEACSSALDAYCNPPSP
jgi:hypothetical protein